MQTNVAYHNQSEKLLERFEEISTEENVSGVKQLSTSIQIDCKCGCQMVEHFAFENARQPKHYERYFVQLCSKHELTKEELEAQ